MPTDNNQNTNTNANSDDNNTSLNTDIAPSINKEACAKYGISLREVPLEPVEPHSRYNEDDTVYGFITEVTHDQKGTEIEIKDWGYCLENNTIELGFQNMPRSQIMEEVIKSYGLIPLVDFTDLRDDIISWNNSTSSSSSSNTGGGGNVTGESSGSASIDEAVTKAIEGKTDPLDKAKAIDKSFKDYIIYEYYFDCQYPDDLEGAWKDANLNCADGANVLCAMFGKGGLEATIIHVPGHYIVKVMVNGKAHYTDNAANTGQHTTRPFGEVWNGTTSGTDMGKKLSS